MPVRCLKYISTARLVGQRVACRRNAGIAGDVVPAAAHCLGEGAKAERTARVQRYVVAVFVVMPQDPHLGGGLCRVWWAVDGVGWRVGGQQGVGSGGEIQLACAEVVELAADRFCGGTDQVFDLIGRKGTCLSLSRSLESAFDHSMTRRAGGQVGAASCTH